MFYALYKKYRRNVFVYVVYTIRNVKNVAEVVLLGAVFRKVCYRIDREGS